jgi:cytidine deaminase
MNAEDRDALLRAARLAARNAYCRYSGYHVGAAIQTDSGEVFTGCNVENASYGLTVCAERTALFSAVAAGHRTFTALAIVGDGEELPLPCGACRQVLAEFCEPELEVVISPRDMPGQAQTMVLRDLLPHPFRLS